VIFDYVQYQSFLCLFVDEVFVDTIMFLDLWSKISCVYLEVKRFRPLGIWPQKNWHRRP